jgi:hypothetical protein
VDENNSVKRPPIEELEATREQEIRACLADIKPSDRDPSDVAIAELLAEIDRLRARLALPVPEQVAKLVEYLELGIVSDESTHNQRFVVRRQSAREIADTLTAQAGRIGELEAALAEISDPISFMRKRAEAEGNMLNGQMAVTLSQDHNFLKSIARAALAAGSK